jgi:uncharacterized protein (DUF58 family)
MDPETGAVHDIQTADGWLRTSYAEAAWRQRAGVAAAVRAAGAQLMRLRTDSDWLSDLVRFVAVQRHRRRRS